MYSATKTFKTFNEAVQAIMTASGSLAQSDLHIFKAENFDELIKVVREYDDNDEGYNWADVWMGNEGYAGSFMSDLGLEPENLEEQERGIELFNYTTASGTNRVTIRELKSEDGTIKGYEAVYRVESSKPIEYSSAMQSFKNAGWNCSEKTYTDGDGIGFLSDEEAKQKREEYEQSIIKDMRSYREIPDVCFFVSFSQGHNIPYVVSHVMSNDPNTISTLLQNHPELHDEVIEIINEQLAKMDEIEIPTTYNFNESVYEDSNFYVEKRDEIIQTLTTIRDGLLKEKLASKEYELSSLEAEEKTISEAEQLIDKQTVKEGEEVGEE